MRCHKKNGGCSRVEVSVSVGMTQNKHCQQQVLSARKAAQGMNDQWGSWMKELSLQEGKVSRLIPGRRCSYKVGFTLAN